MRRELLVVMAAQLLPSRSTRRLMSTRPATARDKTNLLDHVHL